MNNVENIWPEILSTSIYDDSAELHFNVPKNLEHFKGHFPQTPILAGVVQLHWAVEFTKKIFNSLNAEVKDIEVLKFKNVIIPDQDLTLVLHKKNNNKVHFLYKSKKGEHASGRILFKEIF